MSAGPWAFYADVARLAARRTLAGALAWWWRQPNHVPGAILLLGAFAVFYGYEWAPPQLQADAWNVGGAFGRLLLLLLVVLAYRGAPVALAALWWCFEDGQVVLCTVLYLLDPWLHTGAQQCSSRWGLPMGLVGLALGVTLGWAMLRMARRARQETRDDPAP